MAMQHGRARNAYRPFATLKAPDGKAVAIDISADPEHITKHGSRYWKIRATHDGCPTSGAMFRKGDSLKCSLEMTGLGDLEMIAGLDADGEATAEGLLWKFDEGRIRRAERERAEARATAEKVRERVAAGRGSDFEKAFAGFGGFFGTGSPKVSAPERGGLAVTLGTILRHQVIKDRADVKRVRILLSKLMHPDSLGGDEALSDALATVSAELDRIEANLQ